MKNKRLITWSFRDLFRFSAEHRAALTGGAILAVAQSGILLLVPLAAGAFAEATVARGAGGGLPAAAYVWALLPLFALYATFGFGSNYLISASATAMGCRLRQAVYERLQSLPMSWFNEQRTGRILGLLAVDVEAVTAFLSGVPSRILPIAVMLIGSLVLLARMEAWVLLAATLFAPPLYLLVRKLSRPLPRLTSELADLHGELYSVVQENVENLTTIKAFTREGAELDRYRSTNAAFRRVQDQHLKKQLLVAPVTQFLAASGVVGLIAFASLRPDAPVRSPGELVTLLLYGILLTKPLIAMAEMYVQVQQTRVSLNRLGGVWKARTEGLSASGRAGHPVRGAIDFEDVHFRYATRGPVLRGLDLRIRPGEFVALTGPNGGGKTTIAHLLVRFYEPYRGSVRIDGRDIRDIDRISLRGQVGLATQQTQLFCRSVRDNIAFGLPCADAREIEEAARRAGANTFIAALPQGYETPIGEHGVNLSGGQRQRIALARVILKDPAILVLDEATSMFDPEGEYHFLERNREWLRKRTVLLITHRRGSLQFADRILLVQNGRVTESRPVRHIPPATPLQAWEPFPTA